MNASAAFEQRSLNISKWTNLVMGVSGVVAAHLSNADAFLVDGLYSMVNFFSAIVAARVGLSIARDPDPTHPFGYDIDEALYVTFRSLVLLGILAFASMSAVGKIGHFFQGGEIAELQHGPIIIYVLSMVVLCFGLSHVHYYYWKKTEERSEVLKTERQAAILDGVMSFGTGLAFMALPLVEGTPLGKLTPVADAIIVLVLCLLMVRTPVGSFLNALKQVAGESAAKKDVASALKLTEASVENDFDVLHVSVQKMGRSYLVVPYLKPKAPLSARAIDLTKDKLLKVYEQQFGKVRTEVLITEKPPF